MVEIVKGFGAERTGRNVRAASRTPEGREDTPGGIDPRHPEKNRNPGKRASAATLSPKLRFSPCCVVG